MNAKEYLALKDAEGKLANRRIEDFHDEGDCYKAGVGFMLKAMSTMGAEYQDMVDMVDAYRWAADDTDFEDAIAIYDKMCIDGMLSGYHRFDADGLMDSLQAVDWKNFRYPGAALGCAAAAFDEAGVPYACRKKFFDAFQDAWQETNPDDAICEYDKFDDLYNFRGDGRHTYRSRNGEATVEAIFYHGGNYDAVFDFLIGECKYPFVNDYATGDIRILMNGWTQVIHPGSYVIRLSDRSVYGMALDCGDFDDLYELVDDGEAYDKSDAELKLDFDPVGLDIEEAPFSSTPSYDMPLPINDPLSLGLEENEEDIVF